MIGYVALGLLVLALVLLAGRWFVAANPRTLVNGLRIASLAVGGGAALFFVFTGRIPIASLILGALVPLVVRWQRIAQAMRNARGHSPGQQSEVSTRYLRMRLEHDTGVMSGTVLEGPHKGRVLHELSRAELIELLHCCRIEDPQAASLLETYLDRTDADWRSGERGDEKGDAPPAAGGMTASEAYRVLGLEPGASKDAVKQAHRELMQKLHPDRGGSSYLAAKLNEAKDLLLRT